MTSLDDVIGEAQEHYGLAVTEQNHSLYQGFLKRQQYKHHYNLERRTSGGTKPYVDLLIDSLLLFSYLMRERITKDETGQDTRLDSEEKLHLLQTPGEDRTSDSRLRTLYTRRRVARQRFRMPTYVELVDEIGSDPEVRKLWGRKITYKNDIQQK